MAIANVEDMHACFPKHFRMGTATMNLDKDTEEEGKKRRVNKWKEVKQARKKEYSAAYYSLGQTSPRDGYSLKQWINYLTNLIKRP